MGSAFSQTLERALGAREAIAKVARFMRRELAVEIDGFLGGCESLDAAPILAQADGEVVD